MKRILFLLAPTFLLCLHSDPAWSGRLDEVISVCGAPGNQTVVGMASDAVGGALVTWIDERAQTAGRTLRRWNQLSRKRPPIRNCGPAMRRIQSGCCAVLTE